MSLKLYNTLTNKKEIFEPIEQGKVGMYVCGVTVYDNCHLGHARAYVAFDILVRYFRYQGYKVNYVRNITDIEDKIIERANENSESIYDLTSRTIASMHADFQGLGLIEPNSEPKATEYIPEMIELIEDLISVSGIFTLQHIPLYRSSTVPSLNPAFSCLQQRLALFFFPQIGFQEFVEGPQLILFGG